MSNVITSIFPYTYNVTTTAENYPVPLFPGAYIFRGAAGSNGLIPIYTSISNFSLNGMSDILNDKDAQVIVLPGFSLNLYAAADYISTVYSYDNSGGTDLLYRISTGAPSAPSASSCRLFYKFPSGNVEIGPYILSITYDATSVVTYNGVVYRLYQFQTGVTRTFSINGTATDNSPLPIQALLIGGGGGGGNYFNTFKASAGGGAGSFVTTSFTAIPGHTFTVTVGAGGAGAAANSNNPGLVGSVTSITRTVNSVVDATLTAGGGGGGGSINQPAGNNQSFGSTGGGSGTTSATTITAHTVTGSVFTNIISSSFRGGTGQTTGGGGGGGGAGGVGGNGILNNNGGDGGPGKAWFINGTTYAGGGGGLNGNGYTAPGSTGGTGGGGGDYENATANTGSGGGAGFAGSTGGLGGSGICIIAIPMGRIA